MIHEASYKHWNEHHTSIWQRRWTIAATTLKAILGTRGMKPLITSCWMGGLAIVALLFVGGQLLVEDSVVYQWLRFTGSNARSNQSSLISTIVSWLKDHPEISVRAGYNIIFYYFTWVLSPVAVLLSAMAIPHLITRDLASNAITIYSSKAVSRFDYFIGKFGAIFGLYVICWLAPVVVAWLMGNFLAPDWHFFWHSRLALFNSLFYLLSSMLMLSLLVLGISAVSSREKTTIGVWLAWYIFGGLLVNTARETKPWLKYLSFKFNLDQISLGLFNLKDEFERVVTAVPLLNELVKNLGRRVGNEWQGEVVGAMIALSIMCTVAMVILARKVRTE